MNKKSGQWDLISALVRPFPDPFGALFEKEMRTLIRMPRFRVLFGMACVFSLVVFMPVAMQAGENSFMGQNAVPVTSLYGLLLLSDALLLNIFGFDRGAAQVYFATPPKISAVIHAKNLAAVIFIALQSLAIPLLSVLFRIRVTLMSVAAGFLSAAVVTIFLLATGNMLSVVVPRPIDPKSAFRKQGATKVQLWLLMTTFGMFLLVGSAFLARWATDQDWVLLATLGFEFLVGLVVYQIAMESTVERLNSRREQMMAELSKNTSPMGS
jgi:ABC-2 type transport system permease protein